MKTNRTGLGANAALVALAFATGVTLSAPRSSRGANDTYVNWESPQVHPITVTDDGEWLVAVNTADNRVELFRLLDGIPRHRASIDVGLEPISVRAAPDEGGLWVVNRISDTISIVDLDQRIVLKTIDVGDEPGDVVFANNRAFVSVGTENAIYVYELPYTSDAVPTLVPIEGEDPRALTTDGTTVYAAIFNSGNRTGVLHHLLVTTPTWNPYWANELIYPFGFNPSPNFDLDFFPAINPALLVDEDGDGELDIRMPRSSLMMKQTLDGSWVDDNGGDFSAFPWWVLNNNGMASIDAASLAVNYSKGLMTNNMAIDANPASGQVAVVGTHAFNHVRFEPNVRGRFVSIGEALVDSDLSSHLSDPNPHLSEFFPDPMGPGNFLDLPSIEDFPSSERVQAIGDPRGVAWLPDGDRKIITGRGSNNIVLTDTAGTRLGMTAVGQGPTGVVVHPALGLAYVLNQFDATISVIDTASLLELEIVRPSFHDPTPGPVRNGRPHFYGTHRSSALGQASCASCHVDGDMDLLAWDLGDPGGDMKEFNQTCLGASSICDEQDWHPMKGPMTTQTLFGIIGNEPFHWRGDRENLAAFNPAFESLQGASQLSDVEMAEFEAFVATLTFPPNPNRNLDGSLPTVGVNGGDPQRGELLFTSPLPESMSMEMMRGHVGTVGAMPPPPGEANEAGEPTGFNCVVCHALPTGSNNEILGAFPVDDLPGLHHLTKVAPLRNMYRKDGFSILAEEPINRATGFLHDGSMDSLDTFLTIFFGMLPQDKLDIEAFLFAFDTETHAGMGTQVTLFEGASAEAFAFRDLCVDFVLANDDLGLIVKGLYKEETRGFHLLESGEFQSDRLDDVVVTEQLDTGDGGNHLTYTVVPGQAEVRMGIDRDEDGFFDQDEEDTCHDPANAESFPGDGFCCGDIDFDHKVGFGDLVAVLAGWGDCVDPEDCPLDLDGDGRVGFGDVVFVLAAWGDCPVF